jgi:hypothetical protein
MIEAVMEGGSVTSKHRPQWKLIAAITGKIV